MGHRENISCSTILAIFALIALITTSVSADDDRCKDESFCRAYCLSTNPDTVSARCGRDLASCICITPDNHAVKVRFIEERTPVPPTPSTTPRPVSSPHGVQYVDAQALPSTQYNGNGNSIAGGHVQQQAQQQQQQSQLTPVLLECDASEISTRMCHLFCTMEIRAWYGLCNITSKACACFGIPLSAVQQEPIAAIFHSTAPVTPPPTTTTPKPTYAPPRPGYQQFYPPQQYLHQQPQQQQQQWRPIQPATNYQGLYNNNQHYPASPPTVLNSAPAHNHNQHQEREPVRSAASLFGPNGQPVSAGISTPDNTQEVTLKSVVPVSFNAPLEQHDSSSIPGTGDETGENLHKESTVKQTRRRRSIFNETADRKKGRDPATATGKDSSQQGECTKFKCAIACKRNNYFSPDCMPKCIDEQCWCECFPRL